MIDVVDLLEVGDRVEVASLEGFGGTGRVVEVRGIAGSHCKVLLDDRSQPPFWAHDFELAPDISGGGDSRPHTLAHIAAVRGYLAAVSNDIEARAEKHDRSKLSDPEKAVFDEFTPKLRASTYGSDEYKSFLAAMKPALDHHYASNSHHPEHYRWHCPVCSLQINDEQERAAPQGPNDSGKRYCPRCCRHGMLYESELMLRPDLGVRGMSLLDVVEMLADWKAATERHADGSLAKSIEINQKRFGYSDDLRAILTNTAKSLGWI